MNNPAQKAQNDLVRRPGAHAATPHLADLVNMTSPQDVISEAKLIIISHFPEFDFKPVLQTYYDTIRLYKGEYEGYKACNTQYHDYLHVSDVFLALIRLVHGYSESGHKLSERSVRLGMIAALMHDIGFIQQDCDTTGTGAKYMLTHVERSISFMDMYCSEKGMDREERVFIRNCILSTDNSSIPSLTFPSEENETLAKMLATADIIGQMADRLYLEKLLFLYYELREGGISDYQSELDVLQKTRKYYRAVHERLTITLGNYDRFLLPHFQKRWNIDADLYRKGMEQNLSYLDDILENHETDYRERLRRGGMIRLLPTQ